MAGPFTPLPRMNGMAIKKNFFAASLTDCINYALNAFAFYANHDDQAVISEHERKMKIVKKGKKKKVD